ncbi:MAG: DNA gyrase subunit A [Actinobacteria bacterium]|nr:DNA gyrase subunit A [Actinomycetota bacterium]
MEQSIGGRIQNVVIEDEVKKSYLDYAMSVIVGRALPDVRDGLKPVHRRILFAMHELGMSYDKPYKKCARIVGEVLGKFHPHGDVAVYDTLVRMAQDFTMRYELIDGQGNFGSVDGDSPAAMRYTEARLSKLAMELLRDIDKETVNFTNNFDNTLQEPVVLPSRFPNLLINGSSGIAVGMATNIPPHNLTEVIDGINAYLDDPEIPIIKLMKHIKGPDFPTGGIIMGMEGIQDAYNTGKGVIRIRGKAFIEETKSGKSQIVVNEIPFQVNKSRLIEKIAELVREKKIPDISDLRDESDKSGMRIVIEIKRDSNPRVVLNQLIKHTQLQESFGIIMLALVDGVPRTLDLKSMLKYYVEYQIEVITRRTKFELKKAEERAHILEGLLIALSNLDEVINLIKTSKTVPEARERLMRRFKLSEIQAQAILDMRLQRLTGLEREKIAKEHEDLVKEIARLKAILADPGKVIELIRKELNEIKKEYGDDRRTIITAESSDIEVEETIPEENVVIAVTHSGYVKRLPVDTYRKQRRGGRGVLGMDLKENDFVEHLFISTTHHYVLFFSNKGKVYRLKVHELPVGSRISRGQAAINLLPFMPGERIKAIFATKEFEEGEYIVMITKNGIIKKTTMNEYDSSRRDGIIAISLQEKDELIDVRRTDGKRNLIVVTKLGKAIKFKEEDVRPMGRTAMGVIAIKQSAGDEVVGMDIADDAHDLLVVSSEGYGKRTPFSDYPLQTRGGKGVKTFRITKEKGHISGMSSARTNEEIMIISNDGILIRIPVSSVKKLGRDTMGVKLMNLTADRKVASFAKVSVEEDQ